MTEPIVSREFVTCGHEYQEGAPTATDLCRCGTYSIGFCGDCRRPVCGNCSRMVEGLRLCTDDVQGRAAAKQAQQEAEQQRHNEWASGTDIMTPGAAFTLLYLDLGPDERQVTSAVAALQPLSAAEYTSTAIDVLSHSGIAPTAKRLSYRKKTGFMSKEAPDVWAWQFVVHIPSQYSDTSNRLWLCTDGRWANASSSGSGTWQASSGFTTTELIPAWLDALINVRAERIRNWIRRGDGPLNPAVTG